MSKKNILVLTGSPRKNGNSEMMADAFIKGASSVGHEVVKFEAAAHEIHGCNACNACWSNGSPCSFYKDDFDKLYPLLENADMLVFANPLYWYTFPSQIKTAIDRFYSYFSPNCKRPLKITDCMLLSCAEETQIKAFNGLIATYKEICHCMEWNDAGILTVTDVCEKGSILNTDGLDKAEKMGKSIV